MFVGFIFKMDHPKFEGKKTSQVQMFIEDFKFVKHYFGLVTLKTQGNCFDITSLRPHGLNQFLTCGIKRTNIWQFPNC